MPLPFATARHLQRKRTRLWPAPACEPSLLLQLVPEPLACQQRTQAPAHQCVLHVERCPIAFSRHVTAVRLQDARANVIAQVRLQNEMSQELCELRIQHRAYRLDTLV